MKKIVVIAAVVLIALLLVGAKRKDCEKYHLVLPADTIRYLTEKYDVTAWDIIKSNRDFMQSPNYPLFLGAKVCINKTDLHKTIAPHILDAPPAEMNIVREGNYLRLYLSGFPKGSNWYVKINGDKVAKVKVLTKSVVSYRIKVGSQPGTLCLKNHTTDFNYCKKYK